MKFEIFSRPQTPPEPSSGFPSDAVVVVIPRVLLERLLTLVIVLAFGGTMQITLHSLNMPIPATVKAK